LVTLSGFLPIYVPNIGLYGYIAARYISFKPKAPLPSISTPEISCDFLILGAPITGFIRDWQSQNQSLEPPSAYSPD